MSYPSLSPNRSSYDRRRKRRRLILMGILVVVVGLIALALRYRTEERRANDYMALATDVAESQAGGAGSLTQMLTDLGALDRPDLLNQIDTLAVLAVNDAQALAAQEVPSSVAEAHGFLTVAVGSWRDALGTLDDAVLLTLDSPDDDPGGPIALGSVFDLLRVGDRAYDGFLEARSRIEGDVAVGSIAEVEYVAPDVLNLFDGEVIANRLRATRKLDERHDISVTATTVPQPLGTSNGRPVVPSSATFEVLAVVTNEGNLTEEGILVTLELKLAAGGDEGVSREQLVLILAAGEATTIEFADLVLEPGGLYNLQITASITQDETPLNNVFELVFIRNQDA
ncbi:MAG: hypothetical protein GY720_03985 [bacterium]|nr:hypothetical protein [bacterium]